MLEAVVKLLVILREIKTISRSIASISYTPVPAEQTPEYMSNLEQYIHYDDLDLLVQSAIIHAQFEMIHPFEDGNGRIERCSYHCSYIIRNSFLTQPFI